MLKKSFNRLSNTSNTEIFVYLDTWLEQWPFYSKTLIKTSWLHYCHSINSFSKTIKTIIIPLADVSTIKLEKVVYTHKYDFNFISLELLYESKIIYIDNSGVNTLIPISYIITHIRQDCNLFIFNIVIQNKIMQKTLLSKTMMT